jgi:RNA polymerase sigma-70 factor, ECF subfamily
MISDQELVQGILARSEHALHEFYCRYKSPLLRFIRGKIDREEDCEEILQDTLFGFLESLRDFHGKSSIKTFLYSICHHKIIDFYRRKKFKHVVFSQVPQLEVLISPLMAPEDELDATLVKEKIMRVLSILLPSYREILIYKYFEGLSVEEIAQKLSLSFKSAESRLFRARKAFVEVYATINA